MSLEVGILALALEASQLAPFVGGAIVASLQGYLAIRNVRAKKVIRRLVRGNIKLQQTLIRSAVDLTFDFNERSEISSRIIAAAKFTDKSSGDPQHLSESTARIYASEVANLGDRFYLELARDASSLQKTDQKKS